ncbi:MAG: hypothetical protein IV105_22135, partial [Rhizobacter sp.]|nr:hypothetical protein [Rhizobacter sp.]
MLDAGRMRGHESPATTPITSPCVRRATVGPLALADLPKKNMFASLRRYFSTDLAIDLGTANTLIYV